MKITWLAAALAAACSSSCAFAAPAPQIDYRIVERIAGPDGGWDFATTDAAGGRLYIARSDAIERIDLATRKAERLAAARRAHQVLVLDGGATVFETDGETGMGRFVASADGKLLSEVATGTKPDAALIDPVTG